MTNPYAPPQGGFGGPGGPSGPYGQSGLAGQARFEGDALAVLKGAHLADVCIKCGARDSSGSRVSKHDKKFQWTPTWARLMIVLCTLGGLIAIAITTKRANLMVPLCQPCAARWSAARTVTIVGVVLLVLSIFAFRLADDPTPGLIFFGVVFVGFIALMLAFVRPRMLIVKKIDDREIWFKGYDRGAAEALIRGQ